MEDLDYDCSLLLGEYVNTRRCYNKVVEEMDNFFKTNISIKYFINLKKLYRRGVTLGHLC